MLHPHDELPFHQVAAPVLQPGTGDPNAYDRYFFHGWDADTGMAFVAALGLYPNRQIVDAAFCVAAEGHQRSVFASGRMSRERATRVGPVAVEVTDPMRELRVTVDAPEQGLQADLVFRARSAAILEPRQTMMDRSRLIMDTCRYAQFGRWAGSLRTGDQQVDVRPEQVGGTRDRSWGVRPLTGGTPAAPATSLPGIYWIWSPLQFDDGCLHLATSEDHRGARTLQAAVATDDLDGQDPWDAEGTLRHAKRVDHELTWEPGRRRAARLGFTVEHLDDRGTETLELTPVGRIHMRGVGYTHLERGHGAWHGELDVAGEELVHADVDPWDLTGLHVQHVVRVTGDREGAGMLEQLHLGAHAPTGLTGFIDPPT